MKQQERIKQTGEVFTPRSLIREMLDRLPNSIWFDPNKTWLEPAAGDGNFLVEIKARLLQAGHSEVHILEHMLFSVELIDDNHWVLQHRVGYLIDGQINPALDPDNFTVSRIHPMTQDLNAHNPYHEKMGLERDEVLHHRNHVCYTALEYDMSFGRTDESFIPVLEVLEERELGLWPETDTPDVGEKYVAERMLGKQPPLAEPAKERVHPQINEVTWGWMNKEEIPAKDRLKKHIYAIVKDDQIIGVGETNNMTDRIPNGYAWCTRTMIRDGSKVIQWMQQHAIENGNQLSFQALFLEQCDWDKARERESYWIQKFKDEGHPIKNSTKEVKVKAEKKPRQPKAQGEGKGGWGVHPKHYGTGKKVTSFFDGKTWEADHDALVDDINASLRAKGKKDLFEDPRPFSSSSGLRGGDKYWNLVN